MSVCSIKEEIMDNTDMNTRDSFVTVDQEDVQVVVEKINE